MSAYRPSRSDRAQQVAMSALALVPPAALRRLAGRAITVDGQTLHPEVQLGLKALGANNRPTFEQRPLGEGRREIEQESWLVGGPLRPVDEVRDLEVPGPAGPIPARLYLPPTYEGQSRAGRPVPLLVYFHGGGWVLGSIDSHDPVCRFLCLEAEVAVLNVGYRLAPEHPFPAGVDDALAAFAWARDHHAELGCSDRVAVGGDSAGGNLSAVVAHQTHRQGLAEPCFQLLLAPAVDLANESPSYELFRTGYFLTVAQMRWYKAHYCPDPADLSHERVSPLLADDLSGLCPAYLAIAGFDPLRDEGIAYGRRLQEAGVRAAVHVHQGLIHGFANSVGVGHTGRDSMLVAAGALRTGVA